VNDNAPVFTSLTSGLLRGGTSAGSRVFTVTAKDVDSSTNGLVTYDLLNAAEFSGLFAVDRASGVVTVTRDVPSPRATYELHVRATDEAVQSQRKSSETRVTLVGVPLSVRDSVGDKNNNKSGPKFSQAGYSAAVGENETAGTSVARVSAKYSDNLATEIEYHLLEVVPMTRGSQVAGDALVVPGAPFFAVDRSRGTVSTAAVLDRESGVDEYRLRILAVVPSPVAVQTAETTVSLSFSFHFLYFFTCTLHCTIGKHVNTFTTTTVFCHERIFAIDYRRDDARFAVSASIVPISDPASLAISETGIDSCTRSLNNHLSDSAQCQKAIGGTGLYKDVNPEALHSGIVNYKFQTRSIIKVVPLYAFRG
jgi:hypothetical protein